MSGSEGNFIGSVAVDPPRVVPSGWASRRWNQVTKSCVSIPRGHPHSLFTRNQDPSWEPGDLEDTRLPVHSQFFHGGRGQDALVSTRNKAVFKRAQN